MNDCFLFMIGACEGDMCGGCKKYLSLNSDRGDELSESYNKDVEEALKPVRAKYSKILEVSSEIQESKGED